MSFAQEIKANTLILRIAGDLIGEDNGSQLVGAVNDAMTHKVLTCIIDISELRYINSSGIGVLITILTKFRNKRRRGLSDEAFGKRKKIIGYYKA